MKKRSVQRISLDPDICVEDLVERYPSVIDFLMQRGIVCMKCGAPVWGSLKDLVEQAGKDVFETTRAIEQFLEQES